MNKLAYCDFIADHIFNYINNDDMEFKADNPSMDLHPIKGYFQSTKKTIKVTDEATGKLYMVTVEEMLEHDAEEVIAYVEDYVEDYEWKAI